MSGHNARARSASGPVPSNRPNQYSVVERIIQAVAETTGREQMDLPPLYDRIDPDALETIVQPRPDGKPSPVRVRFDYAGTMVFVDSDGDVTVTLHDDESS